MYTRSECGCNVCGVAHDNTKVVLQVLSLVWVELGGRNHLTLDAKWSPVQMTARRKRTSVVSNKVAYVHVQLIILPRQIDSTPVQREDPTTKHQEAEWSSW